MNNQIRPRSTALHDPADFNVSDQNGGLPIWWADRSENTYRAEDRQGNTLFTAVSVRLMQPLQPITSTQVFDRNGVPMYSNGWLVGALWNGATLSAQVPGEPQLHYLFTIAQDGKPYAHLIDLSRTGHGSQGEVVNANIPLDGGGPLTYQRGMAVVDDRSGYGPTTLFLLGHSGTQAQLRALSVAAFHADNNTPDWHTLETVTATPAILKGRLQPSPDGQRLAYARTFGTGMGLLQWGGNELRVLSLDPGRLALSGAPLTVTGPTGRITGLDFSPAADYLYFTVSGLSYPTTQRLYRLPLAGGAIAPMAWNVTDVRRNAQQGGTDMLCTTTTGLRRIAQPDDTSPTQTTHALPGIQPALALQPVLIGPDRSTSTRHLGRRRYELTDHLGNVRAVVGDRKLSDFELNVAPLVLVPTSFRADVLSYADYDPFGSLLDERHALAYRFGFQGQEQDDEIHDDPGTSYAYKYRMHDTRVGRFWSVDPLAAKYPHNSPYAFSENRVVDRIELEGLETAVISQYHVLANGETKLQSTGVVENAGDWPGNEYFEQYLVLVDVNKNGPVLYNDYNEATKTWEHGRAAIEMHKGQVKREPFKSKVDYGELHENFANSHEGKRFYKGLQSIPAVAGLALGAGAVVEGTAGLLTYGGLAADIDQLTGASDNIENPELRAAIKLTELGLSAASLTSNTYDAVTAMRATYQIQAAVESALDAAGVAADGSSVCEAMEDCQE